MAGRSMSMLMPGQPHSGMPLVPDHPTSADYEHAERLNRRRKFLLYQVQQQQQQQALRTQIENYQRAQKKLRREHERRA